MDNRNTEQLAVPSEKEQESGRYGSILNVLKISAICFLLDDDLTVLEASNSFYEKTGYSKKEFQTCFQTMRGYYREYPEDWEAIRDRLVYSAENGGADTALNVRMPRKSGGFSLLDHMPAHHHAEEIPLQFGGDGVAHPLHQGLDDGQA